jgi:hypothetical protein
VANERTEILAATFAVRHDVHTDSLLVLHDIADGVVGEPVERRNSEATCAERLQRST